MAVTRRDYRPELWVEALSRLSGADYLARKYLDRPEFGPYLFVVGIGVSYLYGISLLASTVTGKVRFVADPATNLIVPAFLLLTISLRRLNYQAARVVDDLPETDEDVERVIGDRATGFDRSRIAVAFERFLTRTGLAPDLDSSNTVRLAPFKLKASILVAALAFHGSWLLSKPPSYHALVDLIGPYSAVGFYVVQPFSYLLIAELVSHVIGIHVLLPFAISTDRRIDFSDLSDYGGLRPVGGLLKTSAVYLLVLLSVYVVFIAFAIGPDIGDARHLSILFGSAGFILLLFLVPAFWLHRHMRRMRLMKLEAIGEEFAAAGEDGRLPPEVPGEDEEIEDYHRASIKLDRVNDIKAYPLDLGIVEELLLVLALPFLTHVTSTIILDYLRL